MKTPARARPARASRPKASAARPPSPGSSRGASVAGAVPAARRRRTARPLTYVVHEHDARTHHFDLRLEVGGGLVSWAVPKGPSAHPGDKRLAVRVEDHPLAYAAFEGRIPEGHYGAGDVRIFDHGRWIPQGDPAAMLEDGHLGFTLEGGALEGSWALIRMRPRPHERHESWLLIRRHG